VIKSREAVLPCSLWPKDWMIDLTNAIELHLDNAFDDVGEVSRGA
jgi:hypothetical protein